MATNVLVHDRLRRGGFIGFAMAMLAIAHQIDHYVLVEFHAEIKRELGDQRDRFWVVCIHVKDRRLHHLGDIRAVQGRTGVERVAGGEANLVVHDEVDGATGGVAARLRQVEGLHHHPLPGERGVAVDEDRYDLVTFDIPTAVLPGADRTFDHRVNNFQMRGIKCQGDVHRTVRSFDIGGITEVILHVTETRFAAAPFEFVE